MNKLWILLLCIGTLFAQAQVQKMVVSANVQTEDAAKDLYMIEKFFQQNSSAKALKSKYQLRTQMELLDTYVIVTIKPIKDHSSKNQLLYHLKESFPQSFFVEDTPFVEKKRVAVEEKNEPVIQEEKPKRSALGKPDEKKVNLEVKKKEESVAFTEKIAAFWYKLDTEWLALIFLALAGFLLIYRSAKQIAKIKELQKEVEVYQHKVEGDIKQMGDKH